MSVTMTLILNLIFINKKGFSGGIVVDFPNSTKAKKMYLVIDAGGNQN